MEKEIFTNIHNTKQMMQIEIPFLYNTIDTNKDTTLNTNNTNNTSANRNTTITNLIQIGSEFGSQKSGGWVSGATNIC